MREEYNSFAQISTAQMAVELDLSGGPYPTFYEGVILRVVCLIVV